MRTIGAVVVALVLSLLAACSSGSGSLPAKSATAVYLQTMRKLADPRANDRVLLNVGRAVCSDFDAGKPWVGVVADMTQGPNGFGGKLAGEFIGTAVIALCPRYRHLLPN